MENPVIPRIVVYLAACFCCSVFSLPAQEQSSGKIVLTIVKGVDYINNVKSRTSRDTIVQVEDENHRPIAGVAISFALPNDGAGGVFADGGKSLFVTTNAKGQAAMTFHPNEVAGRFEIRVTASFQGRQSTLTIPQSNAAVAPPTHTNLFSAKVLGIIGGAAAGAVGACRAAHCGGWGSSGGNAITINQIQVH